MSNRNDIHDEMQALMDFGYFDDGDDCEQDPDDCGDDPDLFDESLDLD